MSAQHGHIYDHKTLGPVVVVSTTPSEAVVVTLDDFQSSPWKGYGAQGHIDAEKHSVELRTLKARRNDNPETLEQFMARKHDPKWKPKANPKARKLPQLSDPAFDKLYREYGDRSLAGDQSPLTADTASRSQETSTVKMSISRVKAHRISV